MFRENYMMYVQLFLLLFFFCNFRNFQYLRHLKRKWIVFMVTIAYKQTPSQNHITANYRMNKVLFYRVLFRSINIISNTLSFSFTHIEHVPCWLTFVKECASINIYSPTNLIFLRKITDFIDNFLVLFTKRKKKNS